MFDLDYFEGFYETVFIYTFIRLLPLSMPYLCNLLNNQIPKNYTNSPASRFICWVAE